MKAKCPFCEAGCDKCDGGFNEAQMAEGAVFTIKCQDPKCGFENGNRIVAPGLPALPPEGMTDWGSTLECISCEHWARYELVGWSAPIGDGGDTVG